MKTVAVIGGRPAGLMAAEVLSQGGVQADLYDAIPSMGRKFLLAGVGGMNITHSEPFDDFLSLRYARAGNQAAAGDFSAHSVARLDSCSWY
jgi:predicted flavoprotein YhiN